VFRIAFVLDTRTVYFAFSRDVPDATVEAF
jgi:hypothetical protein